MKKILLSLSMIAVVGVVVAGATGAFFSDTETSTGNTFTAGAIDLKVDSQCNYYQYVGGQSGPNGDGYVDVGCTDPDETGPVVMGNWSETDLENGVHKFFSFDDLKPGDKGEDTISLHVYDNDAWGRVLMTLGGSLDNTCTEPEGSAENNPGCDSDGELLSAMLPGFSMWLDQGSTPGFQCVGPDGVPVVSCPDTTEGDNVWQSYEGQPWSLTDEKEFSSVLTNAYNTGDGEDSCGDLGGSVDGHNNYLLCHGLALDGRMVGSTTYYFGLNWNLPWSTGNEVQTDSLSGDIAFEVEQHRNNPSPFDL
ncbi:hypothetical protein A3I84_01820 [Candidatus Nomurabacteria bacterium RIFCSPLOWO2_02_FULL_36_8]|nr:MAG: hypothetical protein A3I84_01820 [Candidatus Nomurabacteria bacterium RIFCSPLOWO2_02_FULL_36_8]